MNNKQWNAFCTFRSNFKSQVEVLTEMIKEIEFDELLVSCQRDLALEDKVPPYPIETPLVYNTALDDITADSAIKLIIVGDNPGKDEQLKKNRRYLVGQSGKIAEGFFTRNPELGIDFRKNAIILNKTYVHTAKTKELKKLVKTAKKLDAKNKNRDPDGIETVDLFETLLMQSQIGMAETVATLHKDLCEAADKTSDGQDPCQLWVVGYGELKDNGVFAPYKESLKECYTGEGMAANFADSVFVFQHFSMNRFSIDLNANSDKNLTLKQNIEKVGRSHRKEILSF